MQKPGRGRDGCDGKAAGRAGTCTRRRGLGAKSEELERAVTSGVCDRNAGRGQDRVCSDGPELALRWLRASSQLDCECPSDGRSHTCRVARCVVAYVSHTAPRRVACETPCFSVPCRIHVAHAVDCGTTWFDTCDRFGPASVILAELGAEVGRYSNRTPVAAVNRAVIKAAVSACATHAHLNATKMNPAL